MTIESVTYISDLNATYPETTTGAGDGDDHLRNIKKGLLNTFPNITGAVTATQAELNYLDIATLGTAAASKALVANGSAQINAAALTWTNLGAVTTVDINGGTIDAASIGATTPAAGAFTTLSASSTLSVTGAQTLTGATTLGTSLALPSGATVTAILDEDTMSSNSATALATQQSIKAYVDAEVAGVGSTDTNWVVVSGTMYIDEFDSGLLSLPIPVTGTVTRVDTAWRFNSATSLSVTVQTSGAASVASLNTSGTDGIDSETSPGNSSVSAGAYFLASCGVTGSGNHGHVTVTLLITVS